MDTNLKYIYENLFNKFKPIQRAHIKEHVFMELLIHQDVKNHELQLKDDDNFINFDKKFPTILFNYWIVNSFKPPMYKLCKTDRNIIHYFYYNIKDFKLKNELTKYLLPWRQNLIDMYKALDNLSSELSTDDLPFAFNCASISNSVDDETYHRELMNKYYVKDSSNNVCIICFKKLDSNLKIYCCKDCESFDINISKSSPSKSS